MTNNDTKDFSLETYIERKSEEVKQEEEQENSVTSEPPEKTEEPHAEESLILPQKPKKKRNKKKLNKVTFFLLKWIPLVILGVTLGFSAYKINAEKLGGNAMPMPFGYGTSIVVSGSMSPAIEAGDCIIVKETKDIKTGDIIVFQEDRSAVVHRVKRIELVNSKKRSASIDSTTAYIDSITNYKDGKLVDSKGNTIRITTKGDANNTEDASINISQVKGKYIGRIRFLGNILMLIKSPIGILIIIALIILIFFLTNRIDKLEHEEEEEKLREEIEELKRGIKAEE